MTIFNKQLQYQENNHVLPWYNRDSTLDGCTKKPTNKTRKNYPALIRGWYDLISQNGPYKYFVTITFTYDASDYHAVKDTNKLLHFLNCKFFSKSYQNKKTYIKGFAVKEYQYRERVHYHIIVKDSPVYRTDDYDDKQPFEALVKRLCEKIIKSNMLTSFKQLNCNSTDAPSKHHAMSSSGIDVIDTYDQEKLLGYFLKKVPPQNADTIDILGIDGVPESNHKRKHHG